MASTIVYNDACADMLSCYFNGTAPPTRFDVALVAYAPVSPWVSPQDLHEIQAVNGYVRRQVVADAGESEFLPAMPTNVDLSVTLKEVGTANPVMFSISGGLQAVQGSSSVQGWALLKEATPSQPFASTRAVVCAAPFDAPITPTTTQTYITITPFNIYMKSFATQAQIVAGLSYPSMYINSALMYRMLRKYFGVFAHARPQLEVALLTASSYTAAAAHPVPAATEVADGPLYSRQDLAASGTISTANGTSKISWPAVTFTCDAGATVVGYAILIKATLPAVAALTDTSYTGPLLSITTFLTAPSFTPVTTVEGMSITVTPTIELTYGIY